MARGPGARRTTFITIAKAAELLDRTPQQVADLAEIGDLDSHEDMGRLMVSKPSVDSLRLRERTRQA